MAFCGKCGEQVPDDVKFCGKCGSPVGAIAPAAAPSSTGGTVAETGLAENVAGLLCYLLGWVTGLIFFLIDKRPSVRFHAAQSMVVFGGLQVIYFILGRIFFAGFYYGGFGFFSMAGLLFGVLELLGFVLWILLMVKAYQGVRFRVPVAAEIAQSFAGK
jgi:uncharacterized membrane protein